MSSLRPGRKPPRSEMPVYDATDTEAKTAKAPVAPQKEPPKKETVTEPVKRREKAPVDMTTRIAHASHGRWTGTGRPREFPAKVEGTETVDQKRKKKEDSRKSG